MGLRPRLAGGQVLLGDLARAAPTLLGNLGGTFVPKASAKAPTFVTWALTERCPLTCDHCDMGTMTPELDRAQRVDLAHRLGASDVWGVSLIGGEPTIVPEVGDVATILKAAGKFVSLGTSGRRIDRHLDWILDAGLDNLTLSVDHHDAAAHDTFRGRDGLFDEVLHAVEQIRARRRGGKPQVQIRCTIHRGNFRELDAFVRFWRPKVDHLVFQIVQDNGIHSPRTRDVLFQPDDRPAFEAAIADLQAKHPFLRSPYLDLAARYVFEPEALHRDLAFRCLLVPATSLTILPSGDAKLCYGPDDAGVGSLVDTDLHELWAAARTRETRKRMQAEDYGCMCWEQACSGNLALLPVQRAVEALGGAAS